MAEEGVFLEAIRAGAGLFCLEDRSLLRVAGEDGIGFLEGQLSNRVADLSSEGPRSGCYAFLLTKGGRIVADLQVIARPGALWLETQTDRVPAALARLERHIVAEDVEISQHDGRFVRFGLEGPATGKILDRAGIGGSELAPEGARAVGVEGTEIWVAAFGWAGESARQLFVPPHAAAAVCERLLAAGKTAGLVWGSRRALEVLRVEAGVPRSGLELDEAVLPAETGLLSRAVDFEKGCYTGQEVVARMASRGRLAHRLVGLALAGTDAEAVAPEDVLHGQGRRVGEVTSTALSPALRPHRARLCPGGRGGARHGARRGGAKCRGPRRRPALSLRRRDLLSRPGWLVVFAKAPRPGAVKTRLCPPLDPCAAAELYRAMLRDVLAESARAATGVGFELVVAVDPPEAMRGFRAHCPPDARIVAQRGADLGARMSHVARCAAAEGVGRLLLRGSDSPGLSARQLSAALTQLHGADLVLSPDPDGGYNLAVLSRRALRRGFEPGRDLFRHEMSTERVLRDTLRRAAAAGLRGALASESFDIDRVEDLCRLDRAAAANGDGAPCPCPRTLSYVERHDLWPLARAARSRSTR